MPIINQNNADNAIVINKNDTGNDAAVFISNSGSGDLLCLDQVGQGVPVRVVSSATTEPLISLEAVTGNARGDVSFASRTADPTSPSEGDMWYNSTANVIRFFDGTSVQDATGTAGVTNLQQAYDGGNTIALGGSTPLSITGAASAGLEIDQAGDGIALTVTRTNTSHSSNLVELTNSGTADAVVINQGSDATGLAIQSSADDSPLIALTANATNGRGDIAFATTRTTDPLTPSASDMWFNSTTNELKYYNGTSNVVIGNGGASTLQDAYDNGNAISIASSPVAVTRTDGGNSFTITSTHPGPASIGTGALRIITDRQQGLEVGSTDFTFSNPPVAAFGMGTTTPNPGNGMVVAMVEPDHGGSSRAVLQLRQEGNGSSGSGVLDIIMDKPGNQSIGINIAHEDPAQSSNSRGIWVRSSATTTGNAALKVETVNRTAIEIDSTGTGSTANIIDVRNLGTGDALFLNQDGQGIALQIESEATNSPIIDLLPAGMNSRGDIAFNTERSSDPMSPSEGDMWYNGSTMKFYNGTTAVDMGMGSGATTLQEAYDGGQTIDVDSGSITLTPISGTTALVVDASNGGNADSVQFSASGNPGGVASPVLEVIQGNNGHAMTVSNTAGAGRCIVVTQNQGNEAISVTNNSTSVSAGGMIIQTAGGNASNPNLLLDSNGNSTALLIDCDGNPGAVVQINNAGAGSYISADNGATLTNGGTWMDGSSAELKENFTELDNLGILQKVVDLPVTQWNYKKTPDTRNIGPTAEEFYALFEIGNDKGISGRDLASIALSAIKAQQKQIKQLQSRIEELES